jgi:RNA polymerase sigma-70 factor (ECF subfamily)
MSAPKNNGAPQDDLDAIRRLQDGDIGGLEFLVHRYQLKAIRTAYLITRDLGLAEDVVQDSFLQVHRSIHSFDATRPFEPWFLRSVINASVKLLQKTARQVQFGDDADESALAELSIQIDSVESQVEASEVQAQIWAAMQKLSPRQRAVIVQRYYLELSEAEMAKASGAARGTVKWLLNAARERLRSLLAERSDK